jgi:glycosyltransferase involved in cell wall biosynthesis
MNSTRHIAIYLPSLRGGGAERIMVTLANAFAERGFKTDLVLAKAEGPYLNDVSERVRVVDLGASRVATSLPALVRYLRRERPDAMLSALNHANVIALLAKRLAWVKTRLVVSERNSLTSSLVHATSWRSGLVGHLMRWTYPWADGVIAVSNGVADDLAATIGLSRDRIDFVYNPINPSAVLQLAEQPFQHPWFAPGEPPVVLGVGRLTAQKDFATLIRAFAQLRAHHHVRLVILGEGELRPDLQSLVAELTLSEDVLIPGFVENPFVWMRQAAVFVLSSAWEGLPGVLLQAMSCGTPIVSTDCPSGPCEILENGRWGRLVPVGDVDALSKAMAATLDEPEHPDVISRAADFNVNQVVDAYLCSLFPKKRELLIA